MAKRYVVQIGENTLRKKSLKSEGATQFEYSESREKTKISFLHAKNSLLRLHFLLYWESEFSQAVILL